MYNRMMIAIGREDLTGEDYAQNHHRVERQQEIEDGISAWTSVRTAEEVERVMRGASVPCGRVFSVKEVVENPHTQSRGLVEEVHVGSQDKGWSVKMSKAVPVLEGCDTRTRWAGPNLGEHNREVLIDGLGLSEAEYLAYQQQGIIGQ